MGTKKIDEENMTSDSLAEILKGIRCYFDTAIPDVVLDDMSPSNIYGAEHLLRLFVKLPESLAYVSIEEETLTRLQQKLTDFLKKIIVHSSFQPTIALKGLKERARGKTTETNLKLVPGDNVLDLIE
ncbi:hypothetical protein F8388_026281 [Cannabis sativa]|uniref:MRG domain-containing protein n=1 Tax=Cannabis sativa TaxID=3483 RepID=A0A7J6EYZ8_CANSA|nr:hypothetical protein F8388_026281 [Cannabis sativa]